MPTLTRVTCDGHELVVHTHFTLRERCKAVPGWQWKPAEQAWRYPASPHVAEALDQAFAGLPVTWSPEAEAWRRRGTAQEAQPITLDDEDLLRPIPLTRTTPWKHQVIGWNFVVKCWGGLPERKD